MEEWLTTYQEYTDAELAEEITVLRAQSRNFYVSQTSGQNAYSRAIAEIRDRLAAATRVKRERADRSAGYRRHGQADFSSVQP